MSFSAQQFCSHLQNGNGLHSLSAVVVKSSEFFYLHLFILRHFAEGYNGIDSAFEVKFGKERQK